MSAVFVLYRKLALKGIFDVIFIEEKIDYEIKTDATKVQERKTLFFAVVAMLNLIDTFIEEFVMCMLTAFCVNKLFCSTTNLS